MKLVVMDPFDNELIRKLEEYIGETTTNFSFVEKYKSISEHYNKEEWERLNNNSNEVSELLADVRDDNITALCYIIGTKDNKLFQLDYFGKINKSFIKGSTSYAFDMLGAETVVISSNTISEDTLVSEGFDTLGEDDGKNLYIKDREKYERNERALV